MDNAAEPYDLVTVLLRLQGFEGMGREIGLGHSIDDFTRGCHRRWAARSFPKSACIARGWVAIPWGFEAWLTSASLRRSPPSGKALHWCRGLPLVTKRYPWHSAEIAEMGPTDHDRKTRIKAVGSSLSIS
jgi:hypothetical protein